MTKVSFASLVNGLFDASYLSSRVVNQLFVFLVTCDWVKIEGKNLHKTSFSLWLSLIAASSRVHVFIFLNLVLNPYLRIAAYVLQACLC